MLKISRATFYRWIAMGLLVLAALILVFQLITFSRMRSNFPPGTTIAQVPVSGLTQQQAADRLTQAYSVPVEVHYADAIFQIKPSAVGFHLDLGTMISSADQQRLSAPFWNSFWNYIWNRLPKSTQTPLLASLDETKLRNYLQSEVATRYDQPPSAAIPVPGSLSFQSGTPGKVLDVDRAVQLISDALRSPGQRVVNLSFDQVNTARPSLNSLQILLQQLIDDEGFDGIAEIYMQDLQSRQELHFAYQSGQTLTPEIAFTAASTMKIPIMVSVFSRVDEPTPALVTKDLESMIEHSENTPADQLMRDVLDVNLGPLEVTKDIQKMDLKNTFLAGMFYDGAPLLRRYTTPANSRMDLNTYPDIYNQTTTLDMGMLLSDIYQCAQNGGGTLSAAFEGKISLEECRTMITYLSRNHIGVLFEAGVPEGTQVAHKHGWIIEYGVMHTLGDAAIIYTPGGNYVLTAFLYHPTQLVWEPANRLMARISTAVYNYYNLN